MTRGPAPRLPRSVALAQRRDALQRDLSGCYRRHNHPSVIVTGTFGAGFLANLALNLGVDEPTGTVVCRTPRGSRCLRS